MRILEEYHIEVILTQYPQLLKKDDPYSIKGSSSSCLIYILLPPTSLGFQYELLILAIDTPFDVAE